MVKICNGGTYINDQPPFGRRDESSAKREGDAALLCCPCGVQPGKLYIQAGADCKWAWMSGDCCGDWSIEFRTQYAELDSAECMEQAVKYWNDALRAT